VANSGFIAENLSNSSPPSPSFSADPDLYESLFNQPPPSILPSEASSAQASDSDLPPSSFTKATKQNNLLNFFSKVPSTELHARWQKRKRDNEDQDREDYMERKQKDEAERLCKLTNKRANNQVSQKKRRDRLKAEKAAFSEAGEDSSVSSLTYTL
jgi:hypothetical protein